MLSNGIMPTWKLAFIPLLALLTVLCALTFALWLSALNAIYRDVQFAVPFALQLGMIVSPVVYESQAVVPPDWQSLYFLNPLAIVIQLYRCVLLDAALPSGLQILVGAASMTVVFFLGMLYFRRMERHFADRS